MKTVKWKVTQIQKVRRKESLGFKALKRAVIELCILVGIFSAFIHGVNERFHDLLGWSHDSVTSLMIWPLYEVLMERTVRLINRDVTGLIICSSCSVGVIMLWLDTVQSSMYFNWNVFTKVEIYKYTNFVIWYLKMGFCCMLGPHVMHRI